MAPTPVTASRATQMDEDHLGLVDALAQLTFLVQGTLARRAAANDVSIIQMRLLGVLRDREPGMNDLARVLELDKSSITGLVDRAERRGLVKRTISKDDRRVFRVKLTKSGRSCRVSRVVLSRRRGERTRIENRTRLPAVSRWRDPNVNGCAHLCVEAVMNRIARGLGCCSTSRGGLRRCGAW
jgi:DNA-binding MarR family transcriptional regulator